ncbi:MAG: hypothetical protein ACM3X3_09805 [Betaproteobacteria bacterium]
MERKSLGMRDIIEIYRHCQAGRGFHCIAEGLAVDRKTVRKYIRAAVEAGFSQDGQNTP